ncbi:MAG: hypothetical protein M1368_01770, partial [Thaumarchaeota archaeon]|nr:hypothetical protein [Nitrososphaerota archaeon]
ANVAAVAWAISYYSLFSAMCSDSSTLMVSGIESRYRLFLSFSISRSSSSEIDTLYFFIIPSA